MSDIVHDEGEYWEGESPSYSECGLQQYLLDRGNLMDTHRSAAAGKEENSLDWWTNI